MKISRRKEKKNAYPEGWFILKNGFFIERIRKKDRLMEKKHKNHNRQSRKTL